ncbi:MAG: hypothetical protein ACKV2V_28280 [Blastocatellia bacterium]
MTTVTVVRKGSEIAIAADTLTKYGYTNEGAKYIANHEKIFRVGESYVAVSGAMTVSFAMREYFARLARPPRLDSISRNFRVWNEMHRKLRQSYFLNPGRETDDAVETTRVRALIANAHGIFGVDSHRCVQEYTRFFAFGSGSEFALGAMYIAYDSARTAREIAECGVQAGAEFDDSTALPMLSFSMPVKAPGRKTAPKKKT